MPRLFTILLIGAFPLYSLGEECFKTILDDFQVSQKSDDANHQNPSITVDNDGNFVITWERKYAEHSIDILMQRFNSNGEQQGNNAKVNDQSDSLRHDGVDIDCDSNGNVMIVYSKYRDYPGRRWDRNIWSKRFDVQGNPYSNEFQVSEPCGCIQSAPAVAFDYNNKSMVTWHRDAVIYAQCYDGGGMQIEQNFPVQLIQPDSAQYHADIGIAGDGTCIIVWIDRRAGNYDIYGQRLSFCSQKLGEEFRINDDVGQNAHQAYPSITVDENGAFVVAWEDHRNGNGEIRDIYAQRFNSNGDPIGDNFRVTDVDEQSGQDQVDISFIGETGKFIIVWRDFRNDGAANPDIYAQCYDNNGEPIRKNWKVNSDTSVARQESPSVIASAEKIYFAWADNRNRLPSLETDIFAKVIDFNPAITPIISESRVFSNQEFWIDIDIGSCIPVSELKIVSFELDYTNPSLLDYLDFEVGACMENAEVIPDEDKGKISVSVYRTTDGFSGQCIALRLKFKVLDVISDSDTVCFSFSALQAHDTNENELFLSPRTDCVEINPGTLVWPGDADNDGRASIFDINPIIAIYWEKSGPMRPNASTNWIGQPCPLWSPSEASYADCDGNGTVDIFDINPVIINFDKTHALSTSLKYKSAMKLEKPFADPPVYYKTRECDSTRCANSDCDCCLDLDINVGSQNLPVQDLKVVSFEFTYSSPENLEFISYDVGSFPPDAIATVIVDESVGKVSASVYRIDGGASGWGTVLGLKFCCATQGHSFDFHFEKVLANNANGAVIQLAPRDTTTICSVERILGARIPMEFALFANYPNPFNPKTTISFQLPEISKVKIDIYNLSGQHLATLVNEKKEPGYYKQIWDGSDLAAGTYFIKMTANSFMQTRKCMLLR